MYLELMGIRLQIGLKKLNNFFNLKKVGIRQKTKNVVKWRHDIFSNFDDCGVVSF